MSKPFGAAPEERSVTSLRARVAELEAEIARLRDGLDAIEGGHPCDEEHREMARATLRTAGSVCDLGLRREDLDEVEARLLGDAGIGREERDRLASLVYAHQCAPCSSDAEADDGKRPPAPIGDDELRVCWCYDCLDAPEHGLNNPTIRTMIVCPACGNKRCPRATDHRFACSGSNEPGQFGSMYGERAKRTDKAIAAEEGLPSAVRFVLRKYEISNVGHYDPMLADALEALRAVAVRLGVLAAQRTDSADGASPLSVATRTDVIKECAHPHWSSVTPNADEQWCLGCAMARNTKTGELYYSEENEAAASVLNDALHETEEEEPKVRKLNVYVAGALRERFERAVPVIAQLRLAGVEITLDWTADIHPSASETSSDADVPDDVRLRAAEDDMDGVRRADFVLLLAPDERGSSGAWVELGVALALKIPVVVAGSKARRTIFTSMAHRVFGTDAEGVAFLVRERRSPTKSEP